MTAQVTVTSAAMPMVRRVIVRYTPLVEDVRRSCRGVNVLVDLAA